MSLSLWKKVLWTDELKFNLVKFDRAQKVWRKEGKAFKLSFIQGTVKFGRGNIMVWGLMTMNGTGKLKFIDGIMGLCQHSLYKTSGLNLKTANEKTFYLPKNNDPKHTLKKAKEFFIQKQLELLEWPVQTPDLKPIEQLWIKKLAQNFSKRKKS